MIHVTCAIYVLRLGLRFTLHVYTYVCVCVCVCVLRLVFTQYVVRCTLYGGVNVLRCTCYAYVLRVRARFAIKMLLSRVTLYVYVLRSRLTCTLYVYVHCDVYGLCVTWYVLRVRFTFKCMFTIMFTCYVHVYVIHVTCTR